MEHVELDSAGNLVLENGTFKIVSGSNEIKQRLENRLRSYMGEWFLDQFSGMPYFQKIFKKPVDMVNVESLYKSHILQTEGVESIETFFVSFGEDENKPRKMNVNFSYIDSYGNVQEVTSNV